MDPSPTNSDPQPKSIELAGKIVLIVEDEATLQSALVAFLSKHGYTVITANDGQQGIDVATEHHPDLIILDIIMPGQDGMFTLNWLRQQEWSKTLPVIILTNVAPESPIAGKIGELEPTYYLTKSQTSLEELLTKINELFKPVAA